MATTRINIDTRGKNIIQLFMSNMNEISALNKLSAGRDAANTYAGGDPWWGADGNVDITWPKKGTYNHTGTWPQKYQRYFVREINLPADADFDESLQGVQNRSTPLSETENDEHPSPIDVIADKFAGKSPRTLGYTDNPYNNADAVGWGRGPQGSFMATKGRKSLYTLLQETWGAFFDPQPVYRNSSPGNQDPAANSSDFNRYFDGTKSYDFTYMSQQGPSYVDEPSAADVQSQAMQGFVLGQIYGGQDPSVQARIRREAQNITADYFRQSAANAEDDSLRAFYENLAGVVSNVDRISQLYVPGWGRPAENYLTRKPLSETLNQNLLLPPATRSLGITSPLSMPGNTNDNGTGPPGQGLTNKTFESLYTRNRAGKVGGVNIVNPVFNNGILGGSAINLLQEPMDRSAAMIKADPSAPVPDVTQVPFSFEKDDARYLTYDRKETGFTSNGPNTNAQPSKMESAVDDVSVMGTAGRVSQAGLARETISLGQGQFFPFTFSTLNKKDPGGAGRHQVCYLQAIINSLGESYTPTWASKHFFGRTEQVHTYTFTDRTIDLSFTIFANEMRQLQNVYERVLWLAQQCYPDFDITGRVSEGPLVALRVGDLFQYKAGMIRSLSYDWMFAGGKWEMTAGMRMPQGVTVTLSYQIIHNTIPSRDTDFYGGPAGGLNAATERYRQIGTEGVPGNGNAFDSFESLEIDEAGYGQRLIPAGKTGGPNDVRSFLDDVKARNYAGVEAEDLSLMKRDDLKVPVAVSTDSQGFRSVEWAR